MSVTFGLLPAQPGAYGQPPGIAVLGRVDKYPVIPVLNRNPGVLSPIMT